MAILGIEFSGPSIKTTQGIKKTWSYIAGGLIIKGGLKIEGLLYVIQHIPTALHKVISIYSIFEYATPFTNLFSQVQAFCKQALLLCESIIHPRAPTLNIPLKASDIPGFNSTDSTSVSNQEQASSLDSLSGDLDLVKQLLPLPGGVEAASVRYRPTLDNTMVDLVSSQEASSAEEGESGLPSETESLNGDMAAVGTTRVRGLSEECAIDVDCDTVEQVMAPSTADCREHHTEDNAMLEKDGEAETEFVQTPLDVSNVTNGDKSEQPRPPNLETPLGDPHQTMVSGNASVSCDKRKIDPDGSVGGDTSEEPAAKKKVPVLRLCNGVWLA